QAGALGRYTNLIDGPGFARAIANTITELRLEQIEPDALTRVAPDLYNLLLAYEAELADHGFTDWPGVVRLAATAGADPKTRHLLFCLSTFFRLLPLRTAIGVANIRALGTRSSEMLITVPANDATTLARLRTFLGIEIVDLDSRSRPSSEGSL